MIEKEVSLPSGDVILSGTRCYPCEGRVFPTVLWLQGSGPIDRDDNMPGQELNNSKAVAHHLATLGIASLRYDKRGVGKSTGDFMSAGHSDFVDDGLNCLHFLTSCENCSANQLFVIGHSEGAIIAPQLSQRFEKLAGIVLLCPFLEDLESELMRKSGEMKEMASQLSGFKSILLKTYLLLFDPVKQTRKAISKIKTSKGKVGRLGFKKQRLYWLRQFLDLNPGEIFRDTNCPTLAIAGSKDTQCLPSDVQKIGTILTSNYESHIIENMSHSLRNEPNKAIASNYVMQLNQAIEPKVLELVDTWIEKEIIRTNPVEPK